MVVAGAGAGAGAEADASTNMPAGCVAEASFFPETGHTVVYKGMVTVVTLPTGQLVTVGAQLVMV